jgi:hypothetical protein
MLTGRFSRPKISTEKQVPRPSDAPRRLTPPLTRLFKHSAMSRVRSWKYVLILKHEADLNSRLAQELAYLQAQIAFDSHDCKYFKTSRRSRRMTPDELNQKSFGKLRKG